MPATKKEEVKTALFLQPINLLDNEDILQSIHVTKGPQGIHYRVEELNDGEMRRYYSKLPPPAKERLHQLSTPGLKFLGDEIKRKHKLQRSGISFETFCRNAYGRQVLQQFEYLKPFAQLLKWYHHLPNPATGNMMTSPCSFSNFKPELRFEVVKIGALLELNTIIAINGVTYQEKDFRRFEFLLESKSEYFLLSWKDYQTIEWLLQDRPQQYAHDATLFARNVLAKLEETYTVNRNNLFAVTTVDALPIQRVLLSEISNSFLVFTPQWTYDGYLAEGPFKPSFETLSGGETIVVKRNQEAESVFIKKLESLHPNFSKQLNGYYYLSFLDAQKKQWFLKVYHQLLEMDVQMLGMDMLSHFRYSQHKPVTDVGVVTEDGNALSTKLTVTFGTEDVPLPELQKILMAGQRAVMLKDGTLGVLSEEWLAQYSSIIKHGKVEKKEIRIPKWMAISEDGNASNNDIFKVTLNENWWQKWERWQKADEIIYPVPQQIKASLRAYQHKGYEWMRLLSEVHAGACLADDMGLGKTLQTICFITNCLAQRKAGKALIVCPSSLIYHWQQEIEKFAPHLTTCVHHGSARNIERLQESGLHIIITSYGTLRIDIEQIAGVVFEVAVIDESHNIKNPAAKITAAVNQIDAVNRVALSGTPVMNNTFDLYSQLQFLLPGMFGSREFFKREYADAIDRSRDPDRIVMLQKLTAPFILRRTKGQVAKDLPEKTESILWCKMSTAQKDLYDGIRDSIRSSLFLKIKADGLGKNKLEVLQGIMKLKQACASPLLLPKDEQTTIHSVKTDVLLNELANLGNHKVLIFSQFKTMLDLLGTSLAQKGLAYYQLDGSTPAKKRSEMIDNFQAEGNVVNLFLISLKAGNAGITLTAADYVFLFDPWWNNAVQQQAIDRTHRIGQTKNVFAYKMICKDTIEERIIQLQQKKTELSDHLVGNEDGFVKQLTREDVEYLFS
ncbi:MAG: DEAD/DEAH box helicase [Chitinophagaceae bacterium]